MNDTDVSGITRLIYEMGLLKLSKRTGWWLCGVREPESVAEHSFRAAIIASLLASLEGADPARASHMAIWHDSGETRIGDIPHIGRNYLKGVDPETITADQTSDLPTSAGNQIREVIRSYENDDTLEVRCARDADKLECIFQAVEYRDTGYENVADWIKNSRAKLKTRSAQRIADVAIGMSSQEWHNTALENVAPHFDKE